jgi:hypothetical protein
LLNDPNGRYKSTDTDTFGAKDLQEAGSRFCFKAVPHSDGVSLQTTGLGATASVKLLAAGNALGMVEFSLFSLLMEAVLLPIYNC